MVYQLNKLFLADEPGRATEQELKELGDSIFAEEQLSDFELNFDWFYVSVEHGGSPLFNAAINIFLDDGDWDYKLAVS